MSSFSQRFSFIVERDSRYGCLRSADRATQKEKHGQPIPQAVHEDSRRSISRMRLISRFFSGPPSPALITAMDTVIRMAMVTITLTRLCPGLQLSNRLPGTLLGLQETLRLPNLGYRHYGYRHYGYRHYGYGVRHAAYGVSRIGYGGYRVGYAGYGGGLRYGRSVGHGYRAGFAGAGYGRGRFR